MDLPYPTKEEEKDMEKLTLMVGSLQMANRGKNGDIGNGGARRSVVIDDQADEYSDDDDDEADIEAALAEQARLEAEILEATTQELLMQDYPSDCCPERCYLRFPCLQGDPDSPFWQGWGNLRIKTFRLIENKYFETAVIAMILISSLALVSWLCFLLEIIKSIKY